MFKLRSGTHGLNEELGWHRGKNDKAEYILCGAECENVIHTLWEYPAYKDHRVMVKLADLLGENVRDDESIGIVERSSYMLGCGLWENH